MDKKDEKDDKECCGSGCGCGRHCCGGKLALVLVLLLIGGLIGYGIGHCGGGRWARCPFASAPMGAPQTTPEK
jgi:hypothetical protein